MNTHEVAHSPGCGPQSRCCRTARHADAYFNVPGGETEFVPSLQHPAPEVKVVIQDLLHRDDQLSVLRRDLGRVVPFEVDCGPVVEVDRLPERVVTGVERPAILVELVAEHKAVRLAIRACPRAGVRGCICVDEGREVGQLGDLAGSINAAEIETGGLGRLVDIVVDDGVSGEEDDDADAYEKESRGVHPSS